MSSKKWLVMFALTVALALAVCAGFNVLADPFGVFGDPILDWYGYNETNNPRTAKLVWLEEHHGDFDSYIIGSSSAASYSVEELNEYLDASFYNLFVYGCDTRDYRDFAAYLLDSYKVKYLVLNLGINEANTYDTGQDSLNDRMHALASGESLPLFYLRYAFSNPRYASDKIAARFRDTDLPQVFDVFDVPTGCYDKRVRDVEKIGDPAVYEAAHGGDFWVSPDTAGLPYIDQCIQSVAEIRDMCAEKGTELIVIASPVYIGQWSVYGQEELRRYKTALAEVVDYWDFSLTPVSYDSRYFYDATHFRNTVGSMVLAEIFGNSRIYRPEDFGAYVTAENCAAYLDELFTYPPASEPDSYTADVPILLYHHIDRDAASDTAVTPETFEVHIRTLVEAGYTAVTFQEMIDYVHHGGTLPAKPVCITLDDGYLSNYEHALPVLEKYGMRATVFAIGVSVGHKEFYKDTNNPITPHFGWEEAREMAGVIDLQSHTWDLHQWAPFETGDRIRTSALPLEGESEADYAAVLAADLERYEAERLRELGEGFCALAYPGGYYSDLTEVLIHQAGIPVTLSIRTDSRNVLVRGLPQSLYALCRWNMTERTGAAELLSIVNGE